MSVRRASRKRASERMDVLFVGAMILLVAGLVAGLGYDRIHREIARPLIAERWPRAERVLEARLHQDEPLELGAVWATHTGMFCGMVNGRHSFSGLAGMTPFAVEGEQAVFALDQTALDFAPYWRDCVTDQWIKVREGSMQAGGCATQLGQRRCVTVVGGA